MAENAELRSNLLVAIEAKDADAFELAVHAAFAAKLPLDLVDVFIRALLMPWHTRHEDLAGALQQMRSPSSVGALHAAATTQFAYLEYDELFGFARKCTWALADIGTPLAREKLEDLAANPNPMIAGYARRRLERWTEELPRKGQRG